VSWSETRKWLESPFELACAEGNWCQSTQKMQHKRSTTLVPRMSPGLVDFVGCVIPAQGLYNGTKWSSSKQLHQGQKQTMGEMKTEEGRRKIKTEPRWWLRMTGCKASLAPQ